MEAEILKQILEEITSMKSDMKAMQSSMTSMQSDMKSMNGRLDTLEKGQEALAKGQKEIKNTLDVNFATMIDDTRTIRKDVVELKSMKHQQDVNTYDIKLLTKEVFQHKMEINRLKEQIKN